MPAQSKQQQKFMGMVHALKKGDMKSSDASSELKKAADSMSNKDAKDFASTSHKGLPKKVKQEILHRLKEYANKMGTNTMGGDDYTSSKKGGLRDNDGYDNVDYNRNMKMAESTKSNIIKDLDKLVVQKRNLKEGPLPQNWMSGRVSDYHTQLRGKKKEYDKGTNFKNDNSGQPDLEEAQAVSGGKVHKFITGKNLGFKGKKYPQIEFETIGVDNKTGTIRVKILAPKEIFGNEMSLDFRSVRRGPYFKTDTSKVNEISADTIHKLADEKGIKWDNEPSFLKLTKQLTGKEHLDDLTREELTKVKHYLEKQSSETSLKEASLLRLVREYAQRLDFSYLIDDEAILDGTPKPKDAIDTTMDEAMIRKAGDIAQKLIPKDTWSRYVSFSDKNSKNKEFVKNMIRDLSQSLNRFYKTYDINVRIQENENNNQNIDMVLGVLSILNQIEDKENRKKVAIAMISKFKEDDINFDYTQFLNLIREYLMGSYEYNK